MWGVETAQRNDEGSAPADPKLIPEWSVDADDQIVVLGLLVVGVFVALLGWNALTGGDDKSAELADGAMITAGTGDGALAVTAAVGSQAIDTPADVGSSAASSTTLAPTSTAPSTSDAAAPADPADPAPLLAAAVETFGSVTSEAADGLATLTGFVGTEADRTTAGEAAAGIAGITAVDNRLVVLEPDVVAALSDNGVTGAEVEMMDTTAIARGEVTDDDARASALAAAVAVPGVTAVVDELTVPAATAVAELNALFELEPIQFASGSADILPASFTTLDRAAAILGDNAAAIEVQGYTDVRGPEVTNFTLSQARADAVVAYLTDSGVAGETLTASGYGETTQFGEGESSEALAANRRVRFELL